MDSSVTDIATEPEPSTANTLISLLYVARGLRGFGDGFAIIILPAYMTALGYDAVAVGIVATASLLGTALLTLITGWIAPRHDLRALLIFGAGLMAATGLAFPGVEHFVLIVLVAFIGTINPSGGDLGVLVPLEHAVLAKSATDDRRTQVFARYSLIGALCTAAGSLAATLPDFLVSHGGTTLGAFRLMFYAYAALGILSAALYRHGNGRRGADPGWLLDGKRRGVEPVQHAAMDRRHLSRRRRRRAGVHPVGAGAGTGDTHPRGQYHDDTMIALGGAVKR